MPVKTLSQCHWEVLTGSTLFPPDLRAWRSAEASLCGLGDSRHHAAVLHDTAGMVGVMVSSIHFEWDIWWVRPAADGGSGQHGAQQGSDAEDTRQAPFQAGRDVGGTGPRRDRRGGPRPAGELGDAPRLPAWRVGTHPERAAAARGAGAGAARAELRAPPAQGGHA